MSAGSARGPRGPLRVIDLFCGAGGLSLGFESAGFDVRLGLDKDPDAIATFRANHPDAAVIEGSITDFEPAEILELAGGHADVIVGGPSCQGFSTAGRTNGWVRDDDDRNQLWLKMLAVVEHVRPRAFLMENVPGLVYWKSGEFGEKIIKGFERLGYAVTWQILLAADYGVPQRRRRMFLVGVLGDKMFRFPQPTHLGGWRRDYLARWDAERERRGLLRHLSCWEAIADLPPVGGRRDRFGERRLTPYMRRMRERRKRAPEQVTRALVDEHLELVRHVPQGGTWRDIPPHLLPDRFRGMRRTDSTNLLGRLDPTLPSYTVTTQFMNVTVGCNTHPYEDRPLSVREGARLQSFPDRYNFVGTPASQARQIGNAVPPILASVLAAAIARHVSPQKAWRYHPTPEPVEPSDRMPLAPVGTARGAGARRRRKDVRPEINLRQALHRRGLRFRVDQKVTPHMARPASIVFRAAKVAVFVNGCFWYGCPEHARDTKSNTKWWAANIESNRRRDEHATEELTAMGWKVVHVWEHEDPAESADRVERAVRPDNGDIVGLGA